MIKIAILASGSGTNAEKIVKHFQSSKLASVELIVTNNPNAGVIDRFQDTNVPVLLFEDPTDQVSVLNLLRDKADVILLAGYLKMIPKSWIKSFEGKILNIHPALLPKFGGQGMYGMFVHRAVSQQQESVTGITIHEVNEKYDEGKTIAQFSVELTPGEDPKQIEKKVRALELNNYAPAVEQWLEQMTQNK
jgi:phosphoribosylglycinamide formyltransferase-1